ncbi:MAG: FAD-dependent oxidoreductase [Myxococcales bacterium]|nr:FAD-dependent oxidoreductase [Myxococcales bacterium]
MSSLGPSSRREALAILLGAPLAAIACRRAPILSFDGRIVGQDVSHAHALREGPMPAERWRNATEVRSRFVVVGAGPAGLSCAWTLARELRDRSAVTVLELESDPGGTSRSGESSVSAFPWGAHYVPTPGAHNETFVSLLREMGVIESLDREGHPVVAEQYLVRDLDERLWFHGQWREGLYPADGASEDDLAQWRRFQSEVDAWVRRRDREGRRPFVLPTTLASDEPEARALDGRSITAWLDERRFTSARLRWMVDYACRDDYGLRAEHTSAWAGLFYFASRVQRPGAAAEELIAFPEGNGRFVKHFADALGDRVRCATMVHHVVLEPDGTASVLAVRLATGALERHRCERVVVAVPRFVADRIVPASVAGDPSLRARTADYSPWLVCNLHLRDRLFRDGGGLEMAWDNVLYDSPALGYVCATHQSLRDHGPTVLTWYLPMCGEDPNAERRKLFAMDWRACADAAVSDIVRAHPDLARVLERVDVMRWGHAMPRPTVGHLARRAPSEPASSDPRVLFAHTDRSGLALFEEALDRGTRAARALLAPRITAAGT